MSYGDAYFYRPGKIAATELAGFRHVIGQSYDGNLGVRFANQHVEILLGYRKPQIEGPSQLATGTATYLAADYTAWSNPDYNVGGTWRDGATFLLKEFVDKYHKNESFFLHAPNGQRLRSYDKGRYFYLIRPNLAAKQWWAHVAAIHKREPHWQGVFVDNVGIDDSKLSEVLKEMQLSGPIQEYAGGSQSVLYQQDWAEFLDVGRLTMPKGHILGANLIGDWFAQRDATVLIDRLDLIMLEAFAPWLVMRKDFKPEHSLNILKRAQAIVDAGKHLICVCHLSSKDTPERFAYEYARYLLIASDKTSCRLVVDGSYSGAPVRIPEMGKDYGKALASYEQQSTSLLTREFEKGLLSVNIERMTWMFTPWPVPTPDPVDDLATIKQQIANLTIALADTDAKARTQYETHESLRQTVLKHEQTILLQAHALKELQDRLDREFTIKF